jgi:hypothetical protein
MTRILFIFDRGTPRVNLRRIGGTSMKRMLILGSLVALLSVVISGCAPGPNELVSSPDTEGKVAGFWQGLWHGLIAPVTFVISLFSRNVQVYEVHNNGNWYDFGFMLGLAIVLGGGGRGAAGRSRR